LKTVTISPPFAGRQTSANTYPVAVGPKGSDHEEVERLFMEELESLRKVDGCLCYVKQRGKVIPVFAKVIATLGDQPERRAMNCMMAGNGSFTARWKYACNLTKISSNLVACDSCLTDLLNNTVVSSCAKCTCWNMEADSELLMFDPPNDYPEELLPDSKKLYPKKLTYEILQNAVRKAHNKYVWKEWSAKQVSAYLVSHGMSHMAIQSVVDNADRVVNLNYVTENKENMMQDFQALENEVQQAPHLYRQWDCPVRWCREQELDQTVDAIMHLLFLGLEKKMDQAVLLFLKKRGKHIPFLEYANGILEGVQRLNLDWCKAISYGKGKFGGWVSENYLAMTRVSKWFYNRVD
jgi:hypothetical protein